MAATWHIADASVYIETANGKHLTSLASEAASCSELMGSALGLA